MFSNIHPDAAKTALSREYYVSESIFQQELEKVFTRQWLLVGHVSGVKSSGQYFVKQVGSESLVITRDEKGMVRAFFNVCRHRGYRILDDWSVGVASHFSCPYHHWTYKASGQLATAPGVRDGKEFSFRDWSLKEVHCETFAGFIYVWLSQQHGPTPLIESLHFVNEEALVKIEPERMKLAHRKVYMVEANWKSLLENDCECYHCGGGGHPSLAISCDFAGFYVPDQNGQHFPLRQGMKTFSMDGELVCSIPLGRSEQPDGFSTGFLSFPNFAGPVFFKDHAVALELTQLSPSRSLFVCEWFVHEDAVEGRDYEIENLIRVFDITNQEDKAFAERNYRGQSSMSYEPGPLIESRESGVGAALALYLEMMECQD